MSAVDVLAAVDTLMKEAHIVQQAIAMHSARAESDISKPAWFPSEQKRRDELIEYKALIDKASANFRALHLAWSKL